MRRNGFTLIELLVVIVILGILITLVSRGLRAARLSAMKAQAKVEMASIETAVKSYWNKYGRLPSDETASDTEFDPEGDSLTDNASEEIISILTMAPGSDPNLNAYGVAFLDPQSGVPEGTFVDPWGYQYRIALDTDYDGLIQIGSETVRRKVAVASVGLYAIKGGGDTNDVVATWR